MNYQASEAGSRPRETTIFQRQASELQQMRRRVQEITQRIRDAYHDVYGPSPSPIDKVGGGSIAPAVEPANLAHAISVLNDAISELENALNGFTSA